MWKAVTGRRAGVSECNFLRVANPPFFRNRWRTHGPLRSAYRASQQPPGDAAPTNRNEAGFCPKEAQRARGNWFRHPLNSHTPSTGFPHAGKPLRTCNFTTKRVSFVAFGALISNVGVLTQEFTAGASLSCCQLAGGFDAGRRGLSTRGNANTPRVSEAMIRRSGSTRMADTSTRMPSEVNRRQLLR